MNQKPTVVICLVAIAVAASWFVWMLIKAGQGIDDSQIGKKRLAEIEDFDAKISASSTKRTRLSDEEIVDQLSEEYRSAFADALLDRLARAMLARPDIAIEDEAILTFEDEAVFVRFVAVLGSRAGINVLGTLDTINAVRIGYEDAENLREVLTQFEDELIDIAGNYRVAIPIYPTPDRDAPLPGSSGGAPFGRSALRFLGVSPGQNAEWGEGVRVAVLDSGVADHSTFRDGQVIPIGIVTIPDATDLGESPVADGHGTAVASIIAGNDPRAPGVAPQVEILSFQLLDENGNSDSFTLAQMISDAVDARAQVINLSVGSYADSSVVRQMVDYATENNVLIVASTGNDASDSIVYPAAYDNVVGVAAVDAQGEHLEFSNAGEGLDLAAPGLAVTTAWPNEQLVEFSGTSASAPFVSGAIAAVMSENPGFTAPQAWTLLQEFTNEAGAPGFDPQLGRGNLNLGRLMERDEPDIYDIAITSHHYDPESTPEGHGQVVQVTLQNRGTETLRHVRLDVNSGSAEHPFLIPQLDPGAIVTHNVPFDTIRAVADGEVAVSSIAHLPTGVTDRNLPNNALQSVVTYQPPVGVTTAETTNPTGTPSAE